MFHSRPLAFVAFSILAFAAPPATRAADILQHVPPETLGFIVVKNLAATDRKVEQLLKSVEADFPAPLALLQAAAGVSEGLDRQGDLMFAVLPGNRAPQNRLRFAVWLPVRDFDRLVSALGGTPGQKITGVSIAEEDVLIAHHEGWALVMDPDDRQRMEQMLREQPHPPPAVATWADWIDAHDVTAVALPTGVQAAFRWAATAGPAVPQDPPEADDDQTFNFGGADASDDSFAAASDGTAKPDGIVETLRAAIRKWAIASPRLGHILMRARLVGCALKLDENGNLRAGLHIHSDERLWARHRDDMQAPPPTLYDGGGFVLYGAGDLHPGLAAIAASAYARYLVEELKNEERMALPQATVEQFVEAAERAGAAVQSAVVLTQPGDQQPAVYTNDFLVIRAASADSFADHARDVMRLWNSMNRDAEAAIRLVFDVEEVKFGARTATQYSLDVAAADGAAEIPEIRQAMEKFFGPGGKLRLWIAPVDERTVLLAAATPEQLAEALAALDRKQAVDWSRSELANVNELLPSRADWRLFFSPQHYHAWHLREQQAITGPVVGGPKPKEFPSTPPVGLAGGIHSGELSIEVAIPAETLKSTAVFLTP